MAPESPCAVHGGEREVELLVGELDDAEGGGRLGGALQPVEPSHAKRMGTKRESSGQGTWGRYK